MNRFFARFVPLMFIAALIAAGCAMGLPATAARGPVEAGEAEASPMVKLALAGRFDDLLHQLQARPDSGPAPLIQDLQRYHDHQSRHLKQRHAAFAKALAQAEKQIEAGHMDAALVGAIEAQNLADDPQQFLQRPEIAKLVAQGEAAAKTAEHEHRWVDAMSDYRLLNLLHQKTAEYRADLKRTSNHVRMLQMYAPDQLDTLVQARADRLKAQGAAPESEAEASDKATDEDPSEGKAKDAPLPTDEPGHLDTESWQVQLQGVEPRIFTETLAWAARKHVDREHTNYASLLSGSIDNLLALLETKGLDTAFPGLGDTMKVRRFRDFLLRGEQKLRAAATPAGTSGNTPGVVVADKLVNKIFAMNTLTVDLPQKVLVYEMTQGATGTLDTFSDVIWPHELAQFNRATRGNFTGVGIQISRRDGRLVVVSPLEGTPAMEAGIRAGDIIAAVDGQSTDNWGLNRAVDAITGPEGSTVTLGIERDGKHIKPYPIHRAKIAIKSIIGWQHKPTSQGGGWNWFIDPKDRIGYIRLTQFLPQTADDLDAAVAAMQESGPIHGLILDLRFNPGGLLDSATSVVDRFITHGDIVSTVDGQHRPTASPSKARRAGTYPDFPLAVLINQGSASAAEITSGALKDHHRAVIIGTRSFGKGSVQDLFLLDNRKALFKLTRQYYELPSGRIIHRTPGATNWGVHPDIKVRMTDQQVADALEYRQEADVIHRDRASGDDAAPAHATDKATPPSARGLIDQGLDPQLETALMVLKTQALAQQTKLAKAK